LVEDLVSLIQRAEADSALKVVVFKSADPDYFIAHVDVTRIGEYREAAVKLTSEASLGMLFRHLSASPYGQNIDLRLRFKEIEAR
jgi:enoyl-CoA hydratase/carnithine racemase